MPRTASTIYEVASRAGVSIATVSRVHRGHAAVTPQTRERVRAAIIELGYRPSRSARSLAGQRHDAIGVVFPDLSGPYYSEVILGFEERASAAGQSVFILATHGRPRAAEQVLELADRVDGLVLTGQTVGDDLIGQLAKHHLPLVLLSRPAAAESDTVRCENRFSARALAAHLLSDGHRTFAFIGDPAASADVAERWSGFRAAIARNGLAAPRLDAPGGFRVEDGHAAAAGILDRPARPDAIVAANDELAIGAYDAARERGLRVPDDVAIAGWDDIALARHVGPGLTTVRQPMRELGAAAASMLLERIAGDAEPPRHVLLPTELIVRGSCRTHREQEDATWKDPSARTPSADGE